MATKKLIIEEETNHDKDALVQMINTLSKIVEENNKTTTAVNRKHRRQNIHLTKKSFKKRSIHPFQKTI